MAKNQKVVVDQCQTCKGIWLDSHELDFFVAEKEALQSYYKNGLANSTLAHRLCPKCEKNLISGTLPHFDVQIECCGVCHGIFLDNGELYSVVQKSTTPVLTGMVKSLPITDKNNLPQFFKQVLDSDEEVVWASGPNALSYFTPMFFGSIVFIVPFAVFQYIQKISGNSINLELSHDLLIREKMNLFFVALALFYIGLAWLRFKNTYYCLTNKRFIASSGVFGIDFVSVDYSRITDLQLNVGVLDKIIGTGSVFIQTASDGGAYARLGRFHPHKIFSVADPYHVFKLVKSLCFRKK